LSVGNFSKGRRQRIGNASPFFAFFSIPGLGLIPFAFALAVCFSHATRHSERCCDGGEDGDYHVDNHFPSFFFVIYRHKLLN
jgi:hypothetical protein